MQKCSQETHFSQVTILWTENVIADVFLPGDSDIDQLFHIVKCLGDNPTKELSILNSSDNDLDL